MTGMFNRQHHQHHHSITQKLKIKCTSLSTSYNDNAISKPSHCVPSRQRSAIRQTVSLCSLFSPILLLFALVDSGRLAAVEGRYTRPSCEFRSDNYSLEWAYEPSSRSVVFVLKAALPPTRPQPQTNGSTPKTKWWSGVGFGNRDEHPFVDFIGVFVSDNGQAGLSDSHIPTGVGRIEGEETSRIQPDTNTNVQTLLVELENSDGRWIKATFARPASIRDTADDHALELEGCNFINVPLSVLTNEGNVLSQLKQLKMCDVAKHCTISLEELKLTSKELTKADVNEYKVVFGDHHLRKVKPEKAKSPQIGQVAHSVDVSGTGDPCRFSGPHYSINWTYDAADDSVHFAMRHPVKKGKWWSAVGIGEWMAYMDIAVIFLEDGKVKRISDHFSSGYDVPTRDVQQDWAVDKARILKGGAEDEVELQFSRAIVTNDKEQFGIKVKDGMRIQDQSMDGCVLFQFAANAGRYGVNYAIHKHEDWPDLYKACDLKTRCTLGENRKRVAASLDPQPIGQNADEGNSSIVAATGTLLKASVENKQPHHDSTVLTLLGSAEEQRTSNLTAAEDADLTLSTSPASKSITTPATQKPTQPSKASGTVLHKPMHMASNADETPSASDKGGNTTAPKDSPSTTATTHAGDRASAAANPNNPNPITTIITINTTTTSSPSDSGIHQATHAAPVVATVGTTFVSQNSALSSQASTSPSSPTSLSTPTGETNQSTHGRPAITEPAAKNPNNKYITKEELHRESTTQLPTTIHASSSSAAPSSTTQVPTSEARAPTTRAELNTPLHTPAAITTITQSSSAPPNLSTANLPSTNPPVPFTLEPRIIEVKQSNETRAVEAASPKSHRNGNATDEAQRQQGGNGSDTKKTREKVKEGCKASKPDLKICHTYFSSYFEQVKRWADKHHEPMENQLGKACSLLNAVPHVPTLCCQIFREKCDNYLL